MKRNEARFFLLRRSAVYVKVAHFNTIDPKADQYPELNPYLYCAGNPIRFIDPTGMKINTSNLEYPAKEKYKLNITSAYEYSQLFRMVLNKLEASLTIFNVKVNMLSYIDNDPEKGIAKGYYDSKTHDIGFLNDETMVQPYVFAEEFFHAYQNDNLGLYEGLNVNFEFEAKVFKSLLADDLPIPYDPYASTVANAILTGMNVDTEDFNKLYREQCEKFVNDNKTNDNGNIHYQEGKYDPPVGLISILKALNE